MSFFKTLIRPDLEEHPERAEVARAANLLQVGEFQLLQLAYADWFGRDMPKSEADGLFASYMLRDLVPPWARHFARRVILLVETGELDDRDPAWHRYDADYRTVTRNGKRRFVAATAVLIACIGGGIWISHLTTEHTTQLFPPYLSDKELKQANQGPAPTP
ncbi:MAG: hypothetical protein V3R85_11085 [Alphaproteobacteria bacterium]